MIRVQFVHGLEGSPQGNKAKLMAQHFEARTPAMDTSDFEGCVALQAAEIGRFLPDVLVGSSFGGAIAVALLQRALWSGPTLLLAQAAHHFGLELALPDGIPITVVHGSRDDIVDPDESRRLAATGNAEWVRFIEVDDDHPLSRSTQNGDLVGWVNALAESA